MGKITDRFKRINGNIFFFIAITVFILWQMLKPGYVLTLDLIFTPKLYFGDFFITGYFLNTFPLIFLQKLLNQFLTGWMVEKIMIVSLFFLIGYLAYIYLPVPKKYYARYFAALFYLINPFVYERFLAGQLTVLFAYAFLPPFIAALIKFNRQPLWKNIFKLYGWLILINIFSLHLFVMSALALVGYFVVSLFFGIIRLGIYPPRPRSAATPPEEGNNFKPASASLSKTRPWSWLIKFLLGGLIFLVVSSYWLVPYFVHQNAAVINDFGQSNWQAFATAGDKYLGTAINVAALYGFWEEHELWADYFLWPKDNFIFWLITIAALFILLISGIVWGIKRKRKLTIALLLIASASFIFSCGVGETVFKNFNWWLFEHLNFWRGFRDSEKWSSYLVLVYAILSGWGVVYLSELWEKKKILKYFVYLLMALAILGTYTELGGFARQLQPVWYPQSWYQAKAMLDKDQSDYQVIFLPWHEYLSLDFNRNIITANPAQGFFGPKIVQGENMEVGGVFSQSTDLANKAIENILLDPRQPPDQALELLKAKKIKYILVMNKVAAEDYLKYPILQARGLQKLLKTDDLTLYQAAGYNINDN
ncbi:MAG TPA: hypothetical protein VMD74_00915 [Candidatus Methylomirabilis sp.]|nr:hypothetical protein [Candidatus Methylomirabilis sp.]